MKRLLLLALFFLAACRTTYQGALTGPSPFALQLTPEQCLQLQSERRSYHAAQRTALYASGAGAVVAGIALAFADEKTAPAIGTGFALAAGGVGVFSETQVSGLDEELAAGGCPR